jgi:A/G-specific adenine glycosylase
LLKLWEGLGYYTRARNLRRSAQSIVENHGGQFPRNFADVLALPGIGRYTAGAIASIAFNEAAPILDGNVIRVLTRLGALRGDPKEKQLNARLWELAEELVATAATRTTVTPPVPHSAGPCSALNQSLMELGATVCTPRAPACLVCPLAALCVAGRQGQAEAFPESKARAEVTAQRYVVAVLDRQGRFLVRQRPAGAVNGGLWEFPNLELPPDAVARDIAADWLSLPAESLVALKGVKHSITRYRISLEVFRAEAGRKPLPVEADATWRTPGELDQLAFTSAHRRILRQLS